jgi:hypothetical protein
MAIGFVIGPVLGGVVGLLAGVVFFDPGSSGMWGAIVAGVVFGALGGFWGALIGLGPPAPDDDPLRRERQDAWTAEDRTAETVPGPRRRGARPGPES